MPLLSTPRARAGTQKNIFSESPLNPTNRPKSAWEWYLEITEIEDTEREREWQDLLDVILVFAALFASFLSTFLIQTLSLLQEDPLGAIQDILLYQTLVMQNSTSGPYIAPVFSPPPYAVAVNGLFFASLGVVLVAAFLCMLVKGWIRELDRKLRGIPDLQKRAVIKELREQGLVRWRLPEILAILPSLIHLSLVLFFIGLVLYLLQVHKLPAFLSIFIFGSGVLLYGLSILIAVIDDFSPFRSMYSRALGVLYRRLYSRLLLPLTYRFSSLMALPQTAPERIHEWMSTFIGEHKPLSEHVILDPKWWDLQSSRDIISQTSAPVLNKLWSSVSGEDTSAYAKSISTSILLQLDDLNIRPPPGWHLPQLYETNNLSIKEAKCLVYDTCMHRARYLLPRFWEIFCASVELLDQHPDPWFHLVTLLVRTGFGDHWWDGSQHPSEIMRLKYYAYQPNIAAQEEKLLQAISGINELSEKQWCFMLCSISTLFIRKGPCGPLDWFPHEPREDVPAIVRILVRLLQAGVSAAIFSGARANTHINLWLDVMMSLLDVLHNDDRFSDGESPNGRVLHARDIKSCGNCNFRDPNCISQLLLLSRRHNLDPSLMRGCLVTILHILIRHGPMNQQKVRLVNQYLDIIRGEGNVIIQSVPGPELPPNEYKLPHTLLCWLRGEFVDSLDDCQASRDIVHEFDLKLTTAGAHPTTSILKVLDTVLDDPSLVTGLKLQNPWLSFYANNLTHSSHTSAIPVVWSADCTSIASKRLDLYDGDNVTPEIGLVTFFLSSNSASIACRALCWYLRLEKDALIHGNTQYFVSFPIIFHKGLSTDEKSRSWLLLTELFVENWNATSSEWRSRFAGTFFGYESSQANNQSMMRKSAPAVGVEDEMDHSDMETNAIIAQSDGLTWMEDVWMTILRPMVREVSITPLKTDWPDLSGVMHAAYPESAEPEDSTSLVGVAAYMLFYEMSDGTLHGAAPRFKPVEERLADSANSILRVLALLLEAGADAMPRTLLDRVGDSCLLSDERLYHDVDSLCRIEAVLRRNRDG